MTNPIHKILQKHGQQNHTAKDFWPILLTIIMVSGILLIFASYLAKTTS